MRTAFTTLTLSILLVLAGCADELTGPEAASATAAQAERSGEVGLLGESLTGTWIGQGSAARFTLSLQEQANVPSPDDGISFSGSGYAASSDALTLQPVTLPEGSYSRNGIAFSLGDEEGRVFAKAKGYVNDARTVFEVELVYADGRRGDLRFTRK
ncbi:MAG: hypothetical protein R3362_08500 [Rhodothermales bacterium]|nr:hypothetical protein [Rhodothermales bacterium]